MNPDTAVISIGRNTKDGGVLSYPEWSAFKCRIREAAGRYGTPVFEGEGFGVYKGKPEPSYTVIVSLNTRGLTVEVYRTLADLATEYGQDCIALTHGYVEFVRGQESEVMTRGGFVPISKTAIK